ncbi:hypothetical protein LMIY3S_00583 [Labrys miyagiensis]
MTITSPIPAVCADDEYRDQWRPFEDDPGALVFLVGCQRSGTTWLHLQLAQSGAFRFISAYDVRAHARGEWVHNHRRGVAEEARTAFDDSLLGSETDRGIDTIPAGSNTPEEYGLLIGDGALRGSQPDTTPDTLPRLRELCAKKALLEGRERPLLLKSPPDYPQALPLLTATWPRARLIVMQRHPLRTLQSQVNAWRRLVLRENRYLSILERGYRALFDDPARRIRAGLFLHSPAGVGLLADNILNAHLSFLAWLDGRPDMSILTLRYEDMCTRQVETFARVGDFLGAALPPPAQTPQPRAGAIAADVLAAYETRRAAFRPFLDRYGYSGDIGA